MARALQGRLRLNCRLFMEAWNELDRVYLETRLIIKERQSTCYCLPIEDSLGMHLSFFVLGIKSIVIQGVALLFHVCCYSYVSEE